MTVYTFDIGEDPVIRGKLQLAQCMVTIQGRIVASCDLDIKKAPFQLNNMTRWLQLVAQTRNSGYQQFNDYLQAGKPDLMEIQYVVNDGHGRIRGRGSNQNKLTYRLSDDTFLDIFIHTMPHAQAYQQKLAAGYVPKKVLRAPTVRMGPSEATKVRPENLPEGVRQYVAERTEQEEAEPIVPGQRRKMGNEWQTQDEEGHWWAD